MQYDERTLKEITEKFEAMPEIRQQLVLRLGRLNSELTNDKAKEYLLQGAGRRINFVTRCIKNMFGIFPLGQTEKLAKDEVADLAINLHAFFVNISGLFDNLAWVFVFEYELHGDPKDGKLGRYEVGLFNRKTQIHLPVALRTFLQSDALTKWHSEYSKIYRDALAHRIPLYVPPSILTEADGKKYNELDAKLQAVDFADDDSLEIYENLLKQQGQLGQVSPIFAHSLSEEGRPVYMHAQVVDDYAKIREVVDKFCEYFEPKAQ